MTNGNGAPAEQPLPAQVLGSIQGPVVRNPNAPVRWRRSSRTGDQHPDNVAPIICPKAIRSDVSIEGKAETPAR